MPHSFRVLLRAVKMAQAVSLQCEGSRTENSEYPTSSNELCLSAFSDFCPAHRRRNGAHEPAWLARRLKSRPTGDRQSSKSRAIPVIAATTVLGVASCAPAGANSSKSADPVVVATAVVTSGETPVERVGLGRVQAFNTTVARAQVSGQIVKVEFVEGQTVKPGDRIAQIDPRPLLANLSQDRANATRDRASLANAILDLNRYGPLSTQGLISNQQLESQRSLVAQLRAAVAGDEAVIARDRLQLVYASIRAPISGVTGLRLIDVGNLVSPSDPQGVVTISQIQPIAVLFTLPQTDLPEVRTRMDAAGSQGLEVDAYPQGGRGATSPLDVGRLALINNQVDQASGTITLKAVFPNLKKLLWPGQSVDARLILAREADGLTVPSSAVQQGSAGAYAWVVRPDGTVVTDPISVGPTIGERTVLRGGLTAGQRVVTDGQFNLKAGDRVSATTPKTAQAEPPLKRISQDALGLTP